MTIIYHIFMLLDYVKLYEVLYVFFCGDLFADSNIVKNFIITY